MSRHTLQNMYVMTVLLCAAGLTASMARMFPLTELGGCLAVLIWAFVVGPQSVAFPRHRVQITGADCFIFYCFVLHGPVGGILAAFIGTLGAIHLGGRKLSPQQTAFNLSAVPLAAGLAGYAFQAVRAGTGVVMALLVAATVFAMANVLLVSVALFLEGKVTLRKSLVRTAPGFAASVFVTAAVGGALADLAHRGPGHWTVAGVVAACFLVGALVGLIRDRLKDADAAPLRAPSTGANA